MRMNNSILQDNLKLKTELKKVRVLLIVFTLIHVLYIVLAFIFSNVDNKILFDIILFVNTIFYLAFILFIWLKMPVSNYDKISETILILLFGLLALWVWIQFDKSVEEINKTGPNETYS